MNKSIFLSTIALSVKKAKNMHELLMIPAKLLAATLERERSSETKDLVMCVCGLIIASCAGESEQERPDFKKAQQEVLTQFRNLVEKAS